MALAQYHDSLAEYPPVGIILANERLKENVAIHTIFSNIFRPFSVSIYFCFGCFGLSGYFMETNPSSNAGVKYLYKKFTLSFNIKKDMISLTEYSPSFNIPTSSNTCWVLVGLLFTNCRLTPLRLYLKITGKSKLSATYDLLYINPKPHGKR